jgi:invasion protein IalB
MMHAVSPRALVVAALAVGLATSAVAQDKKAAAPKAAAAPAASAPDGKQSAWVKLCDKAAQVSKDKDGKEVRNERNICLTHHERIDGNSGRVVVSAALREVEGSDKKQFMVMVPLGVALPPGLRVAVYTKEMWDKATKNEKIDDTQLKPVDLKFTICAFVGCTAEVEATPDFLNQLKTGGGLMVLALDAQAQPAGFAVPLVGLAEALGGAPVDNQKYFEARQDLMKRIAELRQERVEKFKQEQLKNLPPPPAGGAAPAAPAAPAKK